jgi:NFU1 iron-sulfur cluster scaffold homolog, mitochondrial
MESKIKKILEERVAPMVALHRGKIDFVSFENGTVNVRLEGTCKGCPLSQLTLKAGVEALLKDEIPEVQCVNAVE